MIDTRTHRCIDCPTWVHHWLSEMDASSGRCELHCQLDLFTPMSEIWKRDGLTVERSHGA